MTKPIGAIVLAAGLSTRMGTNKLLLDWNGDALVVHVVDVALAAGLSPVFVVVGHERDRVVAALGDRPVVTVVNEAPERGQYTSLAAGFEAVRASTPRPEATVVLLGDMPLVTADMLRELIGAYRASRGAVLATSRYDGVIAPPAVYGASLYDELCALDAGCGKRVIKRHLDRAAVREWGADRLVDLDVPGDLERARASFERMSA